MEFDGEWLTADDSAAYLRKTSKAVHLRILAKLRHIGGGPTFYRRNGRIAYRDDDLDAWPTLHVFLGLSKNPQRSLMPPAGMLAWMMHASHLTEDKKSRVGSHPGTAEFQLLTTKNVICVAGICNAVAVKSPQGMTADVRDRSPV